MKESEGRPAPPANQTEKYSFAKALIFASAFTAVPVVLMEIFDVSSKMPYGREMEVGIALDYALISLTVGGRMRIPLLANIRVEVPKLEIPKLGIPQLELPSLRVFKERFLPQFRKAA